MRSEYAAAMPQQRQDKVKATGRPPGLKFMVDAKEAVPLDRTSMRLVMRGWQHKLEMEAAKARLEEISAALLEAHGGGCKLRVNGVATATLSARSSVRVSDPDKLRKVLGDRWDALVQTEGYTARPQLVQMSVDGDEPLAPEIRQCLSIVDNTAVTWRSDY